jgi:hypothetical protein
MPGEDKRDRWVGRHLVSLAAVVIGEEGEAAVIKQLEQDEPRRWRAFRCRGGQNERIRLVDAGRDRLLEPQVEERERIAAGLLLGETADGVFLAHRGESSRGFVILLGRAHFFSSK